jgi:hypothetical protein
MLPAIFPRVGFSGEVYCPGTVVVSISTIPQADINESEISKVKILELFGIINPLEIIFPIPIWPIVPVKIALHWAIRLRRAGYNHHPG